MLLISGAGTFLLLLHGKTGLDWVDWVAGQMEHAEWQGFTFFDFIFPLFLFLAGVSLPFSLGRAIEEGRVGGKIYLRAFWRMVILVLIGIVYSNTPIPVFEPDEIRFVSVLGRIGIAGFFATIIYLNLGPRGRLICVGAILVFYYALMFLVPVPGYGPGDLSFEGNLAGWIDRNFLPGRLREETFDELGLLTQLPAICLPILGAMAGDVLRSVDTDYAKVRRLILFGLICILLALAWHLHFPIMKRLWTSSYILLTGGMSFISMALFYWMFDIRNWRSLGFFFRVVGLNSLVIYLVYRFVSLNYTSRRLFGGLYEPLPIEWHGVMEAIGAVILCWLFLYLLYRARIFVKI